ncbi:sulfite exporter TauE/SafE family protein [Dactylosporangium sp. NPDC050688]|uniref:sulfite exporter TauE/SafE family protein n=1 Tax=Dactylosporangium sp. NPDC050688 TaxID=3157217 RepID=UPI0034111B88
MTWWMYVVLPLAGLGAGLIGSVAGLASLISYPVLLALGLPPVTANVTNSVSLVFSSAGAVAGSRPELTGQGPRLRWLALAAVAGGATGSALLLLSPAETFEVVVPWLIAGASLAILLPRRPADAERHRHHGWLLAGGVALVGVYGGYFGAAAGIVLLALLLAMTPDTFAQGSAAKNVLLGVANAVAACAFALFGPVHWLAVLPLGVGLFAGGRLGPVVIRRSPPAALRGVIAALGLGLAVHLGWQAYR